MNSRYERYLHEAAKANWKIQDAVPFFEPGKPMEVVPWHDIDYLDYYDKLQGRAYGSNGIGRLREVGLIPVSEDEGLRSPYFDQAPEYFEYLHRLKLPNAKPTDPKKMYEQQLSYAKILEESGVEVHWIDFPSESVGPFGPLTPSAQGVAGLVVMRGGTIIGKMATENLSTGRNYWLARWAFNELGISPLLTINGRGVAEMGANVWLAEDIYVTARSASFNQEALDQFIPVVRRTTRADLHVQVMDLPGPRYMDPNTGICSHPDIVIGPLDIGKVIAYLPGIDFSTYRWLTENRYDIVSVDVDEQVRHFPCNVTLLAPGKVIMAAGARKAIAAVRRCGVEVIEVQFDEFINLGGGLDCATAKIRREMGPSFSDR
jgi:N-dimethylarginine dimethylaminohydrolase